MNPRDAAAFVLRAGALTLSIGLAARIIDTAHERANGVGGHPHAGVDGASASFLLSSKSGVIAFEEVGPTPAGGAEAPASAPAFLASSKSFVIGPFGADVPVPLAKPDPTFFSSSKVLAPAEVTSMIELLSSGRAAMSQTLGAEN